MSYTVKRKGKTYEEYKEIILEQVQRRNLDAGDESALLAKLYQANDEWFEKAQDKHDKKERLKKIKDLDMAISFSGISQKNRALVVKQILDGDEQLLSSLESVKDQVDEFYSKKELKELKRQSVKNKKAEMKEWLKSVNFQEWKAADTKKAIIYLMRIALDEDNN